MSGNCDPKQLEPAAWPTNAQTSASGRQDCVEPETI